MKNLILAITFITLTFLSCSKSEDDSPQDNNQVNTPDTTLYEGTWRGNLTPTSDGAVAMIWVMVVTGDGRVNQTHDNTLGGAEGTGIGSITEDGILYLTYDGGGIETGNFNASGTYSGAARHGTLTADSFGRKD
jgi:hypothetical protein